MNSIELGVWSFLIILHKQYIANGRKEASKKVSCSQKIFKFFFQQNVPSGSNRYVNFPFENNEENIVQTVCGDQRIVGKFLPHFLLRRC